MHEAMIVKKENNKLKYQRRWGNERNVGERQEEKKNEVWKVGLQYQWP